ncbi:peroxiredoxin Q [Cucumis melo var. makuwa]|uniref:Peroxiredoxin Q, chloroplastic n=1 Tax=Cucumis melo var. makuwa TaxID=1194695 RepID=A0A5D3BGI6_CUCMM|nr:peroxiredoxin Q [Cucumis melo var. makuwa]
MFPSNIAYVVNKGQTRSPFTLKDQDGRNVSLSKFKGRPVVVYFYPVDEIPGCTKQDSFLLEIATLCENVGVLFYLDNPNLFGLNKNCFWFS